MSTIKIFLFSLLLLSGATSFAQDLIIKKDDTKLFCLIVNEDSLKLEFIKNNDKSNTILSVPRSEVAMYRYADKVRSKKLATRILDKRKYTEMFLAKGDTIYLNNEGDMEFRRTLLTKAEALYLMQRNPKAYKEMKMAMRFLGGEACAVVVACDIFVLPFYTTANMSIQDKLTFSGVDLIIGSVLTISLQRAYKKHFRKAIKVFNADYR